MIRNNIKALVDQEVDIGIDETSVKELRLFKLEPLNALGLTLPNSMLHIAVRHN